MSEYTDNCKRILDFIKTRDWLFNKNAPNFDIHQYIRYFEYGSKKDFFLYPTLFQYKVEILDDFKDKIFNTAFMPMPNGNLSMHTIIQISKNYHIFFLWSCSADNRETVLYGTLFITNPEDFSKFIIDNEKYSYSETQPQGFAAMVNQNRH